MRKKEKKVVNMNININIKNLLKRIIILKKKKRKKINMKKV